MNTFKKKYGLKLTNDNPDGSSAQENQAVRSLKGDSRAPDVLDVSPSFAVDGRQRGPLREVLQPLLRNRPARDEGRPRLLGRRLLGRRSRSASTGRRHQRRRRVGRPAEVRVQEPGRAERQPAHVGLGRRRRLLGIARERRLADDIGPGIDFFERLKHAGQLPPGPGDAADDRLGPDADRDRLGLPQPRLRQGVPGREDRGRRPGDGVYGAYYCQAINATAPHPWAARLWQEFLYSDVGQLLWLKGLSHPARFTDLSKRKVVPKALLAELPAAAVYEQVKFARAGQLTQARAQIAAEWPSKVGS